MWGPRWPSRSRPASENQGSSLRAASHDCAVTDVAAWVEGAHAGCVVVGYVAGSAGYVHVRTEAVPVPVAVDVSVVVPMVRLGGERSRGDAGDRRYGDGGRKGDLHKSRAAHDAISFRAFVWC